MSFYFAFTTCSMRWLLAQDILLTQWQHNGLLEVSVQAHSIFITASILQCTLLKRANGTLVAEYLNARSGWPHFVSIACLSERWAIACTVCILTICAVELRSTLPLHDKLRYRRVVQPLYKSLLRAPWQFCIFIDTVGSPDGAPIWQRFV